MTKRPESLLATMGTVLGLLYLVVAATGLSGASVVPEAVRDFLLVWGAPLSMATVAGLGLILTLSGEARTKAASTPGGRQALALLAVMAVLLAILVLFCFAQSPG